MIPRYSGRHYVNTLYLIMKFTMSVKDNGRRDFRAVRPYDYKGEIMKPSEDIARETLFVCNRNTVRHIMMPPRHGKTALYREWLENGRKEITYDDIMTHMRKIYEKRMQLIREDENYE